MTKKQANLYDNEADSEGLGQEVRQLLAPLKAETATPYLETRVMARLRERYLQRQKLRFWQRVGATSLGVALVLAMVISLQINSPAFHKGIAGKATLVQVEVSDFRSEGVAYAEVVLPDGVVFYSKKYPNLVTQRKLKVQWQETLANLPFVIRGDETGKHYIKVRFFDTSGAVVAEREVGIEFEQPEQQKET